MQAFIEKTLGYFNFIVVKKAKPRISPRFLGWLEPTLIKHCNRTYCLFLIYLKAFSEFEIYYQQGLL